MANKKYYIALPFAVLAILLATWLILSKTENEKSSPPADVMLKEGAKISYSTRLETISGENKTLEFVKGKVVLMNFWAAWCSPCIHEMPAIIKLQEKWKEKGFVVLGVSMDNNPVDGLESLKRLAGIPSFENFKGQDAAISSLFPIEGLPYSVIIDREGIIRFARAGEVEWTSLEAMKWIERLL